MDNTDRTALIEEAKAAIATLYRSGMLARDEEEELLLKLWREISESDKRYSLGYLAGLKDADNIH